MEKLAIGINRLGGCAMSLNVKVIMRIHAVIILTCFAFLTNPRHILAADAKSMAMVVSGESGDSSSGAENSSTALPDLFTGAMSYQIPIEVPAGRNGMDPGIALKYSSNNGDGWIGMGWELELGAIQRSVKNGVSYSSDSYQFKTNSSLSDIVAVGSNEYLSLVESKFSRIRKLTAADGLPYWEVTHKNGVRFLFGQTAASRQDNPGNTSQIFKWCLDRIEDPNGNYTTVSYTKDQGQIYLDRINYTGNVNNSLQPTNYIQFSRDNGARSNYPDGYITNFRIVTKYLLKTITVVANDKLVKAYKFDYINSIATNYSLLNAVQVFSNDAVIDQQNNITSGTSLPSLKFTYDQGSLSMANTPPGNGYGNGGGPIQYYADINGDGRSEYITIDSSGCQYITFYNTDGTIARNQKSCGLYTWADTLNTFADISGDGRAEYIEVHSDGCHYVTFYNADGSIAQQKKTCGGYGNVGGPIHSIADINGDGRSEYITIDPSGCHYVTFYNFDGSIARNPKSCGSFTWADTLNKFADITGDGRAKYIEVSSNGSHIITFYNYDGTISNQSSLSGGYGYNGEPKVSVVKDVNGDGRAEYLSVSPGGTHYRTAYGIKKNLLVSISNGLGNLKTITYKPSTNYINTQLPFPIQTVNTITDCDNFNFTTATCIGNSGISTYSYAGGYYHISERDFRGFNYAKVTGPAGPNGEQNITETWFHQGNDTDVDVNNPNVSVGFMKGQPYRTRTTDASGKKYAESTMSYVPDTNGAPYFNPLYQVDSYTYDGDTSYTQTHTNYTYDEYGNVIREEQYGNVNDPNDDRTTVRTFSPNTSNWIVGLPASENIYQGIGTADNDKIAGAIYYYDDLTSCNATPTNNQTPVYGKLTRVVSWLNGGTSPEARMAYNTFGNLICQSDAKGNITTITYDASNTFPTIVSNPLGQQTVSQYYGVGGVAADKGLYGQIKSVKDPNNATTVMEYDVFGRKTKTTLPDGTWTNATYNSFGTVGSQNVRTDSSVGLWKTSYFDGLGRSIKEKSSGPDQKTIASDTIYNATGTVKQTSLPYFDGLETPRFITYTYDPLGRVTKQSNPDATFNLACYNDGATVKIDANGHQRREVRDALGRLVKVQEYTNSFNICSTDEGIPYATTQYVYDVLGNLRFVTDAKGNQSEMRYDTLGRKYYMSDPDMGVWSYLYDVNGNLTAQTDAKGQTITFVYDALNRPTTKHYPTGQDIVFTYDSATSSNSKGRLSKMTDAAGLIVYNYDNMGRAASTIRTVDGVSYSLTFDYLQGRLNSVTYPDNETVTYGYDNGGNLASAGSYATYNAYNALAQPGTLTFGNGVVTTYQYYPSNNRPRSIVTANGALSFLNLNYIYDNAGNLLSINDANNTTQQSFAYDELNRLSQAASPAYGAFTYSYDQIGNILTKENVNYTYGGPQPHAVTSLSNGKTYSYDANGNIVSDGQRTISYNYDNMPTQVGAINFNYDGNGARIKKFITSPSIIYIDKFYECVSGACTKYIFAGDKRVASKASGQVSYYHTDHLGSTNIVTNASGVKAEEISYLPFGKTNQDIGSNLSHKYTGQEFDSETGLYNYNARLYEPDLGRFLTPDTIVPDPENPQALNRYSYVINNPMLYSDPTGHGFWSDVGKFFTRILDSLCSDGCGAGTDSNGKPYAYGGSSNNSGTHPPVSSGGGGGGGGGGTATFVYDGGDTAYGMLTLYSNHYDAFNTSLSAFSDGRLGGGASGVSLFGIEIPLINNLIDPSRHPHSDAEIAMNFLPMGTVGKATNLVYRGFDNSGVIRYIGRTARNAAERFTEHLNSNGTGKELLNYRTIEGSTELTKIESRVAEQLQINLYGLQKNGGQLLNKINSISPKYWQKYGILP